MPDIAWNKAVWDRDYAWPKDGDEWDDFARGCGVPYEKWKASLVENFIYANITPGSSVLEIGPGHGRWSDMIWRKVCDKGSLTMVDLSPKCVAHLQKKLISYRSTALVGDGRTLPKEVAAESIDFVWSFDTFVHIEEPEVKSYARDLFRAMKHHAMGVIHHPGSPTPEQRRNGARSQMDGKKFREILMNAGFFVVRQVDSWGQGCNLKATGDTMTVFTKP